MNFKIALTALAAATALFTQGAFAQASAPTRAEVKADAKAHKTPAGDAAETPGTPDTKSNTTRAERKATTKAARAEGDLKPAGEAVGGKTPDTKSTTTRAERKAATKAAVKEGTTIKAGEGPDAPAK